MNPFGWLFREAIEDYIQKKCEEAINLFVAFLTFITGTAEQVLEMPVVVQAIQYSQIIAGAFLGVKIAFEAWTTYVLRQNGDPEADPEGFLLRSVSSAVFVACAPWLVRWIYLLGTTVAYDISNLPGVDLRNARSPMVELLSALQGGEYILFIFVAILIAVVLYVLILIQTFIRAAELAVAAVVGSLMALGMTKSDSFANWIREVISLSFSQAVQIFLVKVSFFVLLTNQFQMEGLTVSMYNLCRLLLFIGFLWVTYRSPSFLKQYVYSTGVGKVLGSSLQSIGSAVLLRRFMR